MPSVKAGFASMSEVHSFTIFADYFQFIVQDELSDDDFSAIWTPDALANGTAFGRQAICPGTLRNVDVAVDVVISETEPLMNLAAVDHAVEGSIELPSGNVVVMGCTQYFPDAPRFKIRAGVYRVLAVMTGIATISNEWDPADDKYLVYLWPGTHRDPKLLKHWKADA